MAKNHDKELPEQASERAKTILARLGMPTMQINKCKNKNELAEEYIEWCASLSKQRTR